MDSSALIDLREPRSPWYAWSRDAVETAGNSGRVIINTVAIAELARGYASMTDLDEAFPPDVFEREGIPLAAEFLAGRAFAAYRRAGGPRDSLLPDFYIGAHAETAGYRLITPDRRRIEAYFPSVELVTPG